MPFDQKAYDAMRDNTSIKCHICGGSFSRKTRVRHARAKKHIREYDQWMKGLHSMVEEEE